MPGTVLNSNIFVLTAKSHSSSDNEGAGGRAWSVDMGEPHSCLHPFSTMRNEMACLSLPTWAYSALLPCPVLMFQTILLPWCSHVLTFCRGGWDKEEERGCSWGGGAESSLWPFTVKLNCGHAATVREHPLLGTWWPCLLPPGEACFTLANPDHSYFRRLAWDSSHSFASCLKREDISQFKEKDWLQNLTPEKLIKYSVEKALKGNTCRRSKKRKYAFASLWNCSNRFIGKKVKALYFAVLTLLSC